MPQKKHKPEEIVAKLRQVDLLVSQGRSVAEAVRSIGVTQFTYYRWRDWPIRQQILAIPSSSSPVSSRKRISWSWNCRTAKGWLVPPIDRTCGSDGSQQTEAFWPH
jgi:hypothetical protein